MFCKNCGKLLGSGDKFCPECGTKVTVDAPKPTPAPEPMFFVEKREEPIVEKKARRVVHLDEFNWDLNGYPTENRKTEAVDFDWASVLEDKIRQASPKPMEEKPEPKKEKAEPLGEMPKTVEDLLAALPDHVLEIVEEPEEEPVAETKEEPEAEAPAEEMPVEEAETAVTSLEQIIEDFGEGPDEPTRLIDKAQMKADSVESFYVFSKRQAEYQNLLDQEYDRIQNSLLEQETAEEEPTPTVEEILAEEVPAEEVPAEEAVAEAEEPEEPVVEEEPAEEPEAEPVEEVKEPELVAVVWSMPPAGIVVETEPEEAVVEEEVAETEEAEEPVAEDVVMEEAPEAEAVEEAVEEETAEEAPAEKPVKEQLTFADIFNDEEDEEEEVQKGGGCLKFIAVVLILLVVAELGILGIQYFAKDSEAAKYINDVYGKIVSKISDIQLPGQGASDEPGTSTEEPGATSEDPGTTAETPVATSEITALIAAQQGKNKNIDQITSNAVLVFDLNKDYGYDELATSYAFKDSPWYDTDNGTSVTYGDEIVGTLIQYYSALPELINGETEDVLDYVDPETALYEELEGIAGEAERGYAVSRLEIGEIRTGQKGFYVMVNVTSADKMQPDQNMQTQIVYMEADPEQKEIKIKETKNI